MEQSDKRGLAARQTGEATWLFEALYDFAKDVRDSINIDEIFNRLCMQLREIVNMDVFYVADYVRNGGDGSNSDGDASLMYRTLYINGREIDFDLVGVTRVIPVDDLIYRCLNSDDEPVYIADIEREMNTGVDRDAVAGKTTGTAVATGGHTGSGQRSASGSLTSTVSGTGYGAGRVANRHIMIKPSGSFLAICLCTNRRTVGAMCIRSERKDAFDRRFVAFFDTIALNMSVLIDNSEARSELDEIKKTVENMAKHDILTDIPNRRLLFELVPNVFAHALRTKTKVAFLFLDLDDFKSINDNFGHAAGDDVLKAFKDRVQGLIRTSDIFARVGGDEFIVVMTDLLKNSNAGTLASKIIRETSKPMLIKGDKQVITVSIGISVFTDDGDDTDQLIELADRAMYSVKQNGKGNYMFADALKSDQV